MSTPASMHWVDTISNGLSMLRGLSVLIGSSLRASSSRSIEREGPIHVSNVMLVDPKDGKPTRIGVEIEDGKRLRVSKRSGARLD